jgi:uncharacterized membrane protein YbhN (UPF0104 family)
VRKAVLRLAQVSLTVLVTWFILDRVGVDLAALRAMNPAEWRPNLLILVASCVVLLLGYLFSAALWGRIVRDLGGPTLPVWTAMRLFMVANLGRYVPGKVWQIAGLAYLAKGEGVSGGVATGAAVLGQGVALLAASLLGIGTLFGPNEVWRRFSWLGLVGGIGLAAVIIAAVAVPSLFRRVVGIWCRLTRTAPPENPRNEGNVGLRWLALYVLNWGLYATAFWLLYLSFGDWTTFMQVGPAFAAAYVAGYLAVFAPAGAGVREGFLVVLLQPTMSHESALMLALVARVWTTAVELVPAALFAVMHTRSSSSGQTGT